MEDSGIRVKFLGDAVREPATNKGRYDLITPVLFERVMPLFGDITLRRSVWNLTERELYCRAYETLGRWLRGEVMEDYLAEAAFAVALLMCEPDSTDRVWPTMLQRLAERYEFGAKKYSGRNWESGLTDSRCFDSALRHLTQSMLEDSVEDHLAACLWNILALMHYAQYSTDVAIHDLNMPWRSVAGHDAALLSDRLDFVFASHTTKASDPDAVD